MDHGRFGSAFSEALTARSMSLGALHRSLEARGVRVSLATLSYWRSGQREPEQAGSLRALAEIEQILLLDPGALESLIERRRRRVGDDVLADLSEDHEAIRSMLAQLDFRSPSDRLVDREVTLKYEIGADGAPLRSTYVVVVESIQPQADRRASVLRIRPGAEPPRITPLGGYHLGEVLHDRERGIVVGEMLLDRPLVVGETALLEQEVEYTTPDPDDNCYFYWAVRRMTSVSLWIRFHPELVPARCEHYTILDGEEQVEELETFGSSVSRTVNGFGPGTLGIRWHWS
ncbi:hypothetical protein ASE01_11815 [Nocardioides sp. Root190]|uniref:hypothetical protein n=1 Tax=Nocardioides sp. Root190 TaxID=1736488 RepID=UPI0006F85D2B|nr:hypothetical protein [Nocardioides sp. Root190]KRB77396.1 hypothetical protein ASE01_11815 [Nocardioides sp. Root190]